MVIDLLVCSPFGEKKAQIERLFPTPFISYSPKTDCFKTASGELYVNNLMFM